MRSIFGAGVAAEIISFRRPALQRMVGAFCLVANIAALGPTLAGPGTRKANQYRFPKGKVARGCC